jgi:hypothetical protein
MNAKGICLILTVLWGALIAAIAVDSFGPAHGSWFGPLGLGFIPEIWRMASNFITQYIWSGVAIFWFWIISSLIMFRPAAIENFILRKKRFARG